jgi:hypothetical protein
MSFPIERDEVIRLAILWAERKDSRAEAFKRIREAAQKAGLTDSEIDSIFEEACNEGLQTGTSR